MLKVSNLHVAGWQKEILRGDAFHCARRSSCAHVGPNGSGKSTLAQALLGNPAVTVTSGSITFQGKEITSLPTAARELGMFLAFQNPVAIEGVTIGNLLRSAAKPCTANLQN